MPTLALRTKFKQAENAVATFKEHTLAWIGDVDAKMQRLGMEYVDPADNARCDEFVHDVGRSTLEKKALREALIYAADAKLKELRREIEQRERHDR